MSDLYNKALKFATKAHKGQKRKNPIGKCKSCDGTGRVQATQLINDTLEAVWDEDGRAVIIECHDCVGTGALFPDYITHPIAVAKLSEELTIQEHLLHVQQVTYAELDTDWVENIKAAALLHELGENYVVEGYDLNSVEREFGHEISLIICVLTRLYHEPYMQYIKRIVAESGIETKIIKLADITHELTKMPREHGHLRDKEELAKWILEKDLRL